MTYAIAIETSITSSIEFFPNEKRTCFSTNGVNIKLVLVITCLGVLFGPNCPSAFLNILKQPSKTMAASKFLKLTMVIYPKN